MDRATVVRLYQASLKPERQPERASKPPLKRPKRIDLGPKQALKEATKVALKACFVSPMNGKWCMDVKATGVPPSIQKRLPLSDIDAASYLKQQPIPYGMSALDWNAVLDRLIAAPESNYAYWNACEPPELSMNVIHFYKLDFFVGSNKNFYLNWSNAAKAYRFAMTLYDKYEFDDTGEMAPKAAIADGRATYNSRGTLILNEGDKANESVLALRGTISAFFASVKA